MALIISVLKNDLLSAFESMNNGDNKVFSDKVSKAAKKYAESGDINTIDNGTVPTGVYVGAGTGKISVDDSICEKIVYAACIQMDSMESGGNEYLAEKLASGIHTMVMSGDVDTNVIGTVTPPGSSSIVLNGNASGKLTSNPSPMQGSFLDAFKTMNDMTNGGDEYMAQNMAAAIDAYFKNAVINTDGKNALLGSIGIGAMG